MKQTLVNRLEQFAQSRPDEIVLQGLTDGYTWWQLWQAVNKLSQDLQPFSGKVVALYADNSPEWIIADLAAAKCNVVLLPLPTFFSSSQCCHVLNQAASSAILCRDEPAWLQHEIIVTERNRVQNGKMTWQLIELAPSQPALLPPECSKITFTSGSTGQPKGVCLSHAQQERVANTIVESIRLDSVKHLTVLPLSTLLENIAGVYAPLLKGGTIICLPQQEIGLLGSSGFIVQRFIKTIETYQPDSLILLPEILSALLVAIKQGWQPPVSIQFIAVGGSKVAASLLQQAEQYRLPIYEGYGLSECCSVVSLNTPDANLRGSVGRQLTHSYIDIENSEIIIKNNAFLGYLNQPDSWYSKEVRTGDLGYLDDNGFLHIQGRKKNLLISSYGRNVNPEWPESEVLADPYLQQCVVFGDAKPFCIALIYPRTDEFDEQQIEAWLDKVNQQLPDYARIKRWIRLAQPLSIEHGQLTANGRPARTVILQQFQQQIESLYEESLDVVF